MRNRDWPVGQDKEREKAQKFISNLSIRSHFFIRHSYANLSREKKVLVNVLAEFSVVLNSKDEMGKRVALSLITFS